MQFDKDKTAIVLVEFQKQWTEKGLFNSLIKNQLESRDVVKTTQMLVKEARKLGIKIIHAPLIVDPDNKKGWMSYPSFGMAFTKGTWKSEFVPDLFEEGDLIAKREYYNYKAFDAFYNSSLEETLQNHNIKNMFICGFATDQCPVKTLKTAELKGFNPFLVSDCTATFNSSSQRKAEIKYSKRVVTSSEILDSL